jgi:hypothetical protein
MRITMAKQLLTEAEKLSVTLDWVISQECRGMRLRPSQIADIKEAAVKASQWKQDVSKAVREAVLFCQGGK